MKFILVLLAAVFTFALLAVSAPSPALAHDQVCGYANAGKRASCRVAQIRRAACFRYLAKWGSGFDCRVIRASYSPAADGPHSFAGSFVVPGWCRGSVRIRPHAYGGGVVRWRVTRGC